MNCGPAYAPRLNVEVYRILDAALRHDMPPVGWRGGMHYVIDELRALKGPDEATKLAESISVSLHQLEWARRNGNSASEAEARRALQNSAAAWLNFRILH
jgi:hypothetical protein